MGDQEIGEGAEEGLAKESGGNLGPQDGGAMATITPFSSRNGTIATC